MCPNIATDSRQVVKHLSSNTYPLNCTIHTTDIVKMYPSCKLEDVKRSVIAYMTLYENTTLEPIKYKTLIINLIDIVLGYNYVEFSTLPTDTDHTIHTHHFRQLIGIPMGTSSAPTLADIHYFSIELNARQIALGRGIQLPLYYTRKLDDILSIFPTTENFLAFFELLQHPSLTYTSDSDNTANTFMDICVYKDDNFNKTGILSTCLFQKIHNLFIYLRPDSMLPEHIRINFIRQEIFRIRLLCSDDRNYHFFRQLFYNRLLARTYSRKYLDRVFNGCTPIRHDILHNIKSLTKSKPQHQYLTLPFNDFTSKFKFRIAQLLTPPAYILALFPNAFEDPTKLHIAYSLERNVKSHAKYKYTN